MSTTPETTEETESELGALMKPVQPYIEKYGSKIVLALAAILLLAAVYIFWQRSANAAAAVGWGEFTSATQPEDYADIADQFAGSPAGAWARLTAANGHFSNGVEMSFTSRTAATGSFDKARADFKKLLDNRGTPKQVRERALYGMARLEEAQSGEDTSAAIAAYEKLIADFPGTSYKETAEERIEALKNPSVQKFYAWFKEQDPSIADPQSLPNDPGSLLPSSPTEDEAGAVSMDSLLKSGFPDGDGESSTDGADDGKSSDAGSLEVPELPGPPQSGSSESSAGTEKPEGSSEDNGSEDK